MIENLETLKDHTIVHGYGDVGRRVVERLDKAGVLFVVMDRDENVFQDVNFPFLVGDVTKESNLKKVGIEYASTVIITIGTDSDIIFTILVCRKMNPGCFILARSNDIASIDKMYKAGADYVASLAIIAGQMLGRIAVSPQQPVKDETIMMYEGIEIEKYMVAPSSPLTGKTIAELDLRNTIGCTIIGMQIGDRSISEIDPRTRIEADMTLAVLGNKEQIEMFHKNFVL